MSPITIEESGLAFGPFEDDKCFPVEKSVLFAGVGEGVKMVEFMLVRPGKGGVTSLWCVEAKRSAPRAEAPERFDAYFTEIREKMLNALLLFVAARLGRHGDGVDEIPAGLRTLALGSMAVKFVLIITTARADWLPALQDKLRSVMQPTMRVFKIDPAGVAVLTEVMARKQGLIR